MEEFELASERHRAYWGVGYRASQVDLAETSAETRCCQWRPSTQFITGKRGGPCILIFLFYFFSFVYFGLLILWAQGTRDAITDGRSSCRRRAWLIYIGHLMIHPRWTKTASTTKRRCTEEEIPEDRSKIPECRCEEETEDPKDVVAQGASRGRVGLA